MAYLYFTLLLGLIKVSTVSIAMPYPMSEDSGNGQIPHISQTGMPATAIRNNTSSFADLQRPQIPNLRLKRSGQGQYCEYDFNRSQYCQDGCCGDQYSSRNDVCCHESSSNNIATIVGSSVGGGSGGLLLFLAVGYLIWRKRGSSTNKCCFLATRTNQEGNEDKDGPPPYE